MVCTNQPIDLWNGEPSRSGEGCPDVIQCQQHHVGLVIICSPWAVSEITKVLYRCKLSYHHTYSRYSLSVIVNNYCLPCHAWSASCMCGIQFFNTSVSLNASCVARMDASFARTACCVWMCSWNVFKETSKQITITLCSTESLRTNDNVWERLKLCRTKSLR